MDLFKSNMAKIWFPTYDFEPASSNCFYWNILLNILQSALSNFCVQILSSNFRS